MKEFEKLDPAEVGLDRRIVSRTNYIQDGAQETFLILVDGPYALLVEQRLHHNPKTGKDKWLANQVELPKRGIPWMVDTLEQKFFKTSAEGGLAKGTLHHKELIDGEELSLSRGVAVGGAGWPGYTLSTLSRPNARTGLARRFAMTDELLFEQGFFETLKSIAARIEAEEI